MKPMTEDEKNRQIKKEALATIALFLICFAWHVGFGYALNSCGIYFMNLPLWWIVSTPGVFVVGVAGVIFLLKKVFVNFSLEAESEDGHVN
ncbi:YhdT family protein [Bacilliculturomica massiliensis]|uniref:YhdT family protein n=1 Tax=Bacilliculturomica massiliensis TaxID=1917867 RepID=UPI0013EF0281|nr:YhdT family protein [Bacilliculturomica massiliensis]